MDHIRPQVRGGDWHWWNLVPACATCNEFKGGRLLTELADIRPDLVLYALYADARVRVEWLRLTMPPDLLERFERAVGYSVGTPLIGPIQPCAFQRKKPPRPARWRHPRARYRSMRPAEQLAALRLVSW